MQTSSRRSIRACPIHKLRVRVCEKVFLNLKTDYEAHLWHVWNLHQVMCMDTHLPPWDQDLIDPEIWTSGPDNVGRWYLTKYLTLQHTTYTGAATSWAISETFTQRSNISLPQKPGLFLSWFCWTFLHGWRCPRSLWPLSYMSCRGSQWPDDVIKIH